MPWGTGQARRGALLEMDGRDRGGEKGSGVSCRQRPGGCLAEKTPAPFFQHDATPFRLLSAVGIDKSRRAGTICQQFPHRLAAVGPGRWDAPWGHRLDLSMVSNGSPQGGRAARQMGCYRTRKTIRSRWSLVFLIGKRAFAHSQCRKIWRTDHAAVRDRNDRTYHHHLGHR